jgi:DNA-binding MarR family transcriptional regulator
MHEQDERERGALLEEARQAFKAVVAAMDSITTPVLIDLDLTMAQFKGLRVLSCHDGITVGHIGRELGIGMPAASILVDRLVQLDLASRSEDPVDRRRTLVRLSPAGTELVARLHQGGPSRMRHLLSLMETDDLAALVRGLHALTHAATQVAPAVDNARHENDRIEVHTPADHPAQAGARA